MSHPRPLEDAMTSLQMSNVHERAIATRALESMFGRAEGN
jgi:hypothetical protein